MKIRLTVAIDEELAMDVRLFAARHNVSYSEIAEEAFRDYLRSATKSTSTRAGSNEAT